MTDGVIRRRARQLAGAVPGAVEVLDWLHPATSAPLGPYRLERLNQALPGWREAARAALSHSRPERGRRLLLVAFLPWWLEFCLALGMLLAGKGHAVDLGWFPFRDWRLPVTPFDLRRQRRFLNRALRLSGGMLRRIDLSQAGHRQLPGALEETLEAQSLKDVQYSLQRERWHLDPHSPEADLLALRRDRNRSAAAAALEAFRHADYDAVILPNGSIFEFGAVYRTARFAGLQAVTLEFGEQRERAWLAVNDDVMLQDTTGLWQARGSMPLSEAEEKALGDLFAARRGGQRWGGFGRQWQAGESEGAQRARQMLELDPQRPVALVCTNVVGDSLALGRELFTNGMEDWLSRTVRRFGTQDLAQVVVRVHPGELLGAGLPSTEIVRSAMPQVPAHIRVIPPESKINTYDLIDLADFGMVYTTTVGLEMAMAGLPVVVAGRTHYRGRGFTLDPMSAQEYDAILDRLMAAPKESRLTDSQVQLARRYAYRFFFEYPFVFPWHLVGFWDDMAERPMASVLGAQAEARYDEALRILSGDPIDWNKHGQAMRGRQ